MKLSRHPKVAKLCPLSQRHPSTFRLPISVQFGRLCCILFRWSWSSLTLVAGEHGDVDAASAQCSRRFDRPRSPKQSFTKLGRRLQSAQIGHSAAPALFSKEDITSAMAFDHHGWKAVIHSSRLNDVSAPKTDIPGFQPKHAHPRSEPAWPKTRDLCPCCG